MHQWQRNNWSLLLTETNVQIGFYGRQEPAIEFVHVAIVFLLNAILFHSASVETKSYHQALFYFSRKFKVSGIKIPFFERCKPLSNRQTTNRILSVKCLNIFTDTGSIETMNQRAHKCWECSLFPPGSSFFSPQQSI